MKNKKTKIKALAVSALTAFAMVGVGVGGTFALFTDVDDAQVTITAGKVEIAATLGEPVLTSALADEDGTMVDENGAKYTFQDGWVNGGEFTANPDTGAVTLERMTPGDKAEFDFALTNSSTVNIKYRFVLTADTPSDVLATGMTISIGDASYSGLLTYRSLWASLEPGASPASPVHITFHLPMDKGNEYQNLSTSYHLTFEAVQGNATTEEETSPYTEQAI